MHQGFRKELWTKLVEVLIIDEISMLSGEWLDNLERMLRELTHYYGRGEFQQYLRMPMKDIPASRRCVEINQCVAPSSRSRRWRGGRTTRRFGMRRNFDFYTGLARGGHLAGAGRRDFGL